MTRFIVCSWNLPLTCGFSSARTTFTESFSKTVAEGSTAIVAASSVHGRKKRMFLITTRHHIGTGGLSHIARVAQRIPPRNGIHAQPVRTQSNGNPRDQVAVRQIDAVNLLVVPP